MQWEMEGGFNRLIAIGTLYLHFNSTINLKFIFRIIIYFIAITHFYNCNVKLLYYHKKIELYLSFHASHAVNLLKFYY